MKKRTIAITSTLERLIEAHGLHYKVPEFFLRIQRYANAFLGRKQRGEAPQQILRDLYRKVDQELTVLTTSPDYTISCQKGCAFCCKMNVDLSDLEAQLILAYTREKGIPINKDYLSRQANVPGSELFLHKDISSCIFLLPDNTCGIYEVRPFSCRKYYVTTPAAFCNTAAYPTALLTSIADVEIELIVSAIAALYPAPKSLPAQLLKHGRNLL